MNMNNFVNDKSKSNKDRDFEQALTLLQQGHLVAIPTETVYGLAARIDSPEALKNIFRMKNRPFFDPLIVHVASIDQAKTLVKEWPVLAQILAEKFWPGPLTLVLPKNETVNPLISSGLETVGIRMPQQNLTLELLRRLGIPLAAPSANQFGRVSPTQALHVKEEFPNENLFVLDGGASSIGLESTILSIEERKSILSFSDQLIESENSSLAFFELRILRKGAVTKSQLTECLQVNNFNKNHFIIYDEEKILAPIKISSEHPNELSPGRMKHHYMPSVPMVLLDEVFYCENKMDLKKDNWKNKILSEFAKLPDEIEGVRILRPNKIENFGILKLNEDPALAAREFYHELRILSSQENDLILFIVKKNYQEENWQALMERARKAASLDLT